MLKQIAKRLVGHEQVSWETMAGDLLICLALIFQAALWNSTVHSPLIALTGGMLILFGTMWIFLGNHPLFLENRTISVSIGCRVIIASGGAIIGLGIGMILPLMTEVDWVPRMAGFFYSLAFFLWLFVIIKVAPVITRGLLIGVVFCVIAIGYALVCNVLVVVNALVTDVSHLTAPWEQAIGYVVSGAAVIGWALLVMRKTTIAYSKFVVPAFMLCGIAYIGFGIVLATVLISR